MTSSVDSSSSHLLAMDRLYSPSRWTKRMDPDLVVDYFVAVIAEASRMAKKRFATKLDIAYGTSPSETYDIYYDESTYDSSGMPIVVFIHGGYWQLLSKEESSFMAEPVIASGAVFIAVEYSLCPNVKVEDIVDQIRRAIVHIQQMALRRQSSGIYLVGHSCGAQLATMALGSTCSTDLIKGVLLISGVYDMRPLLETSENKVLNMTGPEAWELSPINPDNLNALCRYSPHTKIVVAMAENDTPTFRQQSKQYHQILLDAGLSSVTLIDVPVADHFDMVERLQDADYELTRALVDMMK